jgi:Macrocin-O-methyltransferase (TylF)
MLESPRVPDSQVSSTVIAALVDMARKSVPGPFVEVGVFQGGTAWHLAAVAREQRRDIWLYDTFTGIPYSGPNDSHKVGDFSSTSLAEVEANIPYARCVPGVFPQSAEGDYGRDFPRHPVAFAHLDCDQERAYIESIGYLLPRMAEGGVMWFDDAPCLPGAKYAVLGIFRQQDIHETEGKWWVQISKGGVYGLET